jgi:peptide chain release factor 2
MNSLDLLFKKIKQLMMDKNIMDDYGKNSSILNDPWEEKLIPLYQKIHQWKKIIDQYTTIEDDWELYGFLANDGDQQEKLAEDIQKKMDNLLKILKYDDDDQRDAIIEIQSGTGGDDAEDWAMMLYKMYWGWIQKNNLKYEIIDWQPSSIGLKNCSIKVTGQEYLFGLLKKETGIHRLVRLSPFNANNKRHTSFAAVNILPVVENDNTIIINPEDLRIDTYKSSGAGGQHVNTTDSAVRITHLPTKIVVQCQNERSQHANKETAMKLLKSKLLQKKIMENSAQNSQEKDVIGFGYQARSYVLHPYQLIKDHRTNKEIFKVEEVLKGAIDDFL